MDQLRRPPPPATSVSLESGERARSVFALSQVIRSGYGRSDCEYVGNTVFESELETGWFVASRTGSRIEIFFRVFCYATFFLMFALVVFSGPFLVPPSHRLPVVEPCNVPKNITIRELIFHLVKEYSLDSVSLEHVLLSIAATTSSESVTLNNDGKVEEQLASFRSDKVRLRKFVWTASVAFCVFGRLGLLM